MTGVAVNVTGVPAQIGLGDPVMVTLTGKGLAITMTTAFEVAGLPLGQGTFEVSTQVTISPFAGVYVYVLLFNPTLTPFTFH